MFWLLSLLRRNVSQPTHLLNKYQINMGFSYFQGIATLSVINILAPYQINKYYNFLHSACLFFWYAIYAAPSMCKWYFVVWVVYMSEIFLLLSAVVNGAFTTYCGLTLTHVKQRLLQFSVDEWPGLNILLPV